MAVFFYCLQVDRSIKTAIRIVLMVVSVFICRMKSFLFVCACLFVNYCAAQDSLDVAYVKTKNDQWQIIDRAGKILADSLFEHESMAVLNCNEGMAITERGGKYGFVSIRNGAKIENKYDSVYLFRDGEAAGRMNGKWEHLSLNANKSPMAKHYLEPFDPTPTCKDGYCLVETDTFTNCKGPDGKLLLAKSDVFIAPWNDVNSFITDRILKYKVMANKVCSCHKMTSYFGFIDRNDKWIIEPDFERADIFSNGLAAVGVGAEEIYSYGYIGMNGDWVIKPIYKEAGRFSRIAIR